MKYARVWFAASLTILASPALALTALPVSSTSCDAVSTASFQSGFDFGNTQGYGTGYTAGYSQGWSDAGDYCFATPSLCGITLGSVLPDPTYGETEPNDNIVAADPLPFNVNFWGQSYGAADEDWFYIVTTQANQNLTINFSVPGGTVDGWRMAIRDSAGNLFADFNTSVGGSIAAPEGEVAYRVTLGFAGTYYIVVQTSDTSTTTTTSTQVVTASADGSTQTQTTITNTVTTPSAPTETPAYYATYNLAAVLQDSPLDTQNFVVGFYDVELEPNDDPGAGTMLADGVTMYGLINLTFDQTVPSTDPAKSNTSVWAQGESDWYNYWNSGPQSVTLTFCGREQCEPGQWFAELYDSTDPGWASGTSKPILAMNTDTASGAAPLSYKVALPNVGSYFLRVSHKRLFTAPCAAYGVDTNNDGIADGAACRCTDGKDSCDIKAVIPIADGSELLTPPGCSTADPLPEGAVACTGTDLFCPDGEKGIPVSADAMQCAATCQCKAWTGVVELPTDSDGDFSAVTSQYNFTWSPTHVAPNTSGTDAYQDYLGRPTTY
jgi:hypothetical protein